MRHERLKVTNSSRKVTNESQISISMLISRQPILTVTLAFAFNTVDVASKVDMLEQHNSESIANSHS